MDKLVETPIEGKTEKELADLNKKITDMSNKLSNLGRSVSKSSMQVNQILKDFERSTIEPQIEQIKSQLASLEKQVEPRLMARYKQARHDGIFPVFVSLENNSCGGCRMELSAAYKNKLKEQGYVECEQCKRLIYTK